MSDEDTYGIAPAISYDLPIMQAYNVERRKALMTQDNGNDLKGLPVAEYRPQSADAVARVNAFKQIEENVLRMLDKMRDDATIDQRWLQMGRTGLETAFMAINRSVFKPDRASLPGDDAPKSNGEKAAPPDAMSVRATDWAADPSKGKGLYCLHTGRPVDRNGYYIDPPQK